MSLRPALALRMRARAPLPSPRLAAAALVVACGGAGACTEDVLPPVPDPSAAPPSDGSAPRGEPVDAGLDAVASGDAGDDLGAGLVWSVGPAPRGPAGPAGLVVLFREEVGGAGAAGALRALFSRDSLELPSAPEPGTCRASAAPTLRGPRLEAGELAAANGDVPDGSDGRGQGIIVRPAPDLAYGVALYAELLRDGVAFRIEAPRSAFGAFLSDRVLRWPLPASSELSVAREPEGPPGTFVVRYPATREPRLALLGAAGETLAVCRVAPRAPGEGAFVTPAGLAPARVRVDVVATHDTSSASGRVVRLETHDVRERALAAL